MSPQKAFHAYSVATGTTPKTRQIVMLYDGAIRFMKQAQQAIAEKRIEDRFRLLSRASGVIVGLQNCIDFENGGEVAHALHKFYINMCVRIHTINLHPKDSLKLSEEIIAELKQMRDAWDSIDRTLATEDTGNSAPVTASANGAAVGESITLSA